LPRFCQAEGYPHIHFGAIRLALTFHGRKGLIAFSRIALVDTRFVEYQHACIGTIQTTLNAGRISITFYPNFNMPLNDPSLLTALKAQIQIGGTPQRRIIKLLPEKWITNYEQIHQTPVQTTTAPEFVCHQNGLVEVKFSPQDM
ncbi:hypothetical protein R6Q59_029424, partial [Mikania micrantha]